MRVGIGADHGGFVMKEQLARKLAEEGDEVIDFGNMFHDPDDDYPDSPSRSREQWSMDMWSGVSCSAAVGWAPRSRPTR